MGWGSRVREWLWGTTTQARTGGRQGNVLEWVGVRTKEGREGGKALQSTGSPGLLGRLSGGARAVWREGSCLLAPTLPSPGAACTLRFLFCASGVVQHCGAGQRLSESQNRVPHLCTRRLSHRWSPYTLHRLVVSSGKPSPGSYVARLS